MSVASSSSTSSAAMVALVKLSSESLSLARITPWVLRPVMRISASGSRTVCPVREIRITLLVSFSSSERVKAAIIFPVLAVVAPTFIPDPPRPCSLYSSSEEIFHIPFSEIVKIYFTSFPTAQPSIRASVLATFIPRTPAAARPITRTSSSGN